MKNRTKIAAEGRSQGRIGTELIMVGRFGLVGIIATGVHMLVVWTLVTLDFLPVLLANLVAFLSAFGISFWGNYHWTFRRPGQKARALRRFFTISSGAFALNMLLLTGLLQIDLLLPEWSALLAATVIPAITFLASRFWGFRSAAESEQEI